MKNTLLLFSFALMSIFAFGQTPQAFKYQAVARDLNGNPVINQEIAVKISILAGSPEGTVEYCELHQTTSNSLGLINLEVGHGTTLTGEFTTIAWGNNASFIKTEMDITGGGNFVFMGTSQLLSVPYSLFSENGVRSMTTEERDALVSPFTGMQIYNSTSNCLNYFNGAAWFETCGQCTPLPTQAHAGEDQNFADATFSTTLQGNIPEHGTGTWTLEGGTEGSFADTNDPQTVFTGQLCDSYSLKWTISTACALTSDIVNISFDAIPTISDAGQDTAITSEALSINLTANTPDLGVGQWTIFSGEGGTFANPSSPATLFTGQSCTVYVLVWKISSPCHSSSDTVSITFFTTPTHANAGENQTIPQATWTTLEANTPLIGQGHWTIVEGSGGQLISPNSPNSIFLGQTNSLYILQWKIGSICTTSTDDVQIIFGCAPPSKANAGPDQHNVAETSTTLQANTPVYGTGQWSIVSGTGGNIDSPESPASSFTGQAGTTYLLNWTVSNECGSNNDTVSIGFSNCGLNFTDTRDEQVYSTVKIGNQCWMAENLNIGTRIDGSPDQANNGVIEKYCYNNIESNCNLYGGLYLWNEMMQYTTIPGMQGICPPTGGWHLPTDLEWTALTTYLGGESVAGGKMKETGLNHWTSPNYGATNSSGFTTLPSGYRTNSGSFVVLGSYANFWSSSRTPSAHWMRYLSFDQASVYRGVWSDETGFAVRCLKDETTSSQLNVTPVNRDVTASAGTTSFEITSNTSWIVEESVSWLSVSPMIGSNNGTLTVSFEANSLAVSRIGQITITADGGYLFVNITVSQAIAVQWSCGKAFTDERNGKNYNTVQIGTQCWMKENMNIGTMVAGISDQTNNGTIEKYCNNNNESNCNIYGGFYQWNEMMNYTTTPGVQGICPPTGGWHLPTDAEWTTLTTFLGGSAGAKMKTTGTIESGTGLWYSPNSGATNSSGFSGLPGGYRNADGQLGYLGENNFFWSSTEGSSTSVWSRYLSYTYTTVGRNITSKGFGLSVRCLKD